MLTDYHLHLRPDAPRTPPAEYFTGANAERYRAVAQERGVAELGCSEHVYRFAQALDVWQHPLWRESATDDLDGYAGFVREQTDLKLGIEADFIAGREDRMASLLDTHDWDFVVGSVHFVGEHSVDHDGYEIWDHRSQRPDELWRRYFRTLGEAARTGMFDILAHPDLVKIWGPRRPVPEGDLRRFYELAMDGIAESQIAVEVSTAGLRKPVGELYPARAFLEMCIDAGCPVALSSDAHVPGDVARDYERALELLDAVGVRELAVFERRERRLEPLG
ncbi:MAG: Histidinol-phosphatase [uncultured Solirubrobacteraceae bacterium]|uniref:Histidinol-phosphatase n=1 Tax=uncultured Solirubrobacteraceae bacterium TaxID=1162706 RepID=A0A6J4TCI8_9ACTN|nr:MAG: Histidinol-phosphatase [uncultured Solirubrobacteraceae bacterium]